MTVRVNGEIVPEEAVRVELLRLVRFYKEHLPGENMRAQSETLLQQAKEQAIGARLLLDEARRRRIAVSDEEVGAAVAKMNQECGGDEAFRRALQGQNLSPEMLRESVRKGIQVDRLIAGITEGLKEPTDEEARGYYKRHQEEFQTAERACVRHILIRPESDLEEDRAIARARLLGIRRQIEGGADFAVLAREHSQCESGVQAGGMLGWISRGTALSAFDRAVFAAGAGELTSIFETPFGYHVAQVLEREEGRTASYEEVRERIMDLIRHSRRGHAISEWVNRLKARADIEDDEMDPSPEELDIDLEGESSESTPGA
jgi:parvulin-like peptidyl-prolyl isomerase